MKKKVVVLIVAAIALAVVLYFALPGLLVKWARDSERKAAELQEKSLRVEDHEIVYLEGGQGEPILMVHGFAANKDNWTRFAKFITPLHHVVALDLPGFGDSTCLENASYSIADQAKRLESICRCCRAQEVPYRGQLHGRSHRGAIYSHVPRESAHPWAFRRFRGEVACAE